LVIRGLRQERRWSQEQLAEFSGLSLRTVQRIESSNSASLNSLAALAAAFEIDLNSLDKELAMDKTSSEWKKRPAWVRALFLGSSRIQMHKQQHKMVEVVALIAGASFVVTGTLGASGIVVSANAVVPLLVSGSLLFLGAYLMTVVTRVGDKYSVWSCVDSDAD